MSTLAQPTLVPHSRRDWRAIGLAIVMHVLLGVLLFFGVRWQSSTPAVIQAELWSASPQTATPAPVRVVPPPKVETPKPPPKVEEEPLPVKPDIVVKQPVKTEPPKKKEPPKQEIVKAPPKVEPAPPKVVAKPPVEAPPKAPSDLANLIASAGAPSTGKDPQTSGPKGDPGYVGAITTKILSNLRFPLPVDLQGNPEALFEVTQLQSGEIVTSKMTKSSGLPAYDAAIARAIEASSPLPKRKDGSVERNLTLSFKPLDKR